MKYIVSYVPVHRNTSAAADSVVQSEAYLLFLSKLTSPKLPFSSSPASRPVPLYLPIFYWLPHLAVAVIPFLLILATPSHLPEHPLLPLINSRGGCWATGINTNTVRAEPCYKKSTVPYVCQPLKEKKKHFKNHICVSPIYNQQVQQSLTCTSGTHICALIRLLNAATPQKKKTFLSSTTPLSTYTLLSGAQTHKHAHSSVTHDECLLAQSRKVFVSRRRRWPACSSAGHGDIKYSSFVFYSVDAGTAVIIWNCFLTALSHQTKKTC